MIKLPNFRFYKKKLLTLNLTPGFRVYGEKLLKIGGKEYRVWDPYRSKLAAAILNGLKKLTLTQDSRVLYLGASSGTTASHISDICRDGMLYCVEISTRMVRDLIKVCEKRENMAPLLEDARKPERYLPFIEKVDLVYCDVAQPDQTNIFIENMRLFLKNSGQGFIAIKARSIDTARDPKEIFKEEKQKLKEAGYRILESIRLEPYERDHIAFLVEHRE